MRFPEKSLRVEHFDEPQLEFAFSQRVVPVWTSSQGEEKPGNPVSREYAAQLAYIGGSMGTLIGADMLDKIGSLGAPMASIGGAATFDGIFLTDILAVLPAGLASPSRLRPAS
jgi:hypothetical protein